MNGPAEAVGRGGGEDAGLAVVAGHGIDGGAGAGQLFEAGDLVGHSHEHALVALVGGGGVVDKYGGAHEAAGSDQLAADDDVVGAGAVPLLEAELRFAPGEAVVGFGVAEDDAPDVAGGEVLAALGVVEVFGRGFVPEAVAALVVNEGVDAVDDPVFPGLVAADEGVGPGGGLELEADAVGDGLVGAGEPVGAGDAVPEVGFVAGGVEPAGAAGVDVAVVDEGVVAGGDVEGRARRRARRWAFGGGSGAGGMMG